MELDLRALILSIGGMPPPASVNWGMHPQDAEFPAIVMNVVGDRQAIHMSGPDGLSSARVQIDCYAMTYAAAKSMASTLRDDLNGYRGGRFQGIFLDAVRDLNETGRTDRPFRTSMDFTVKYER